MIMLLVCSTLRAQPNAAPTCSDAHSATSRPDAPARHSLKMPTSARYEVRSICEGISWDCCEWSAIVTVAAARYAARAVAGHRSQLSHFTPHLGGHPSFANNFPSLSQLR